MEPINYMLDVANPMQMALGGYQSALGQAQTRQQMGLANTQEARAAEAFALEKRAMEEQRAAAAAERQAAMEARQRGDAAMMRLIELGPNATSKDYLIAINENPAYKESLSTVFDTFSEERKAGEIQSGLQLWAAVKSNPDVAASLIAERKRAAEAAGDQETLDTMKVFEAQLAAPGGSDLLTATLGSSLAGLMGADDFKKAAEAIGVGSGEDTEAVQTLIQRAKLAGLVPGTPEYNQFMISGGRTPDGMAIRTTPEGGIEFIQGAGAATPFREQESKDIVFAARAEGALAALDPVADQLANVAPRLLEYVPLGQGRKFQDPLFQVANNAGLEFLAAILRKDTGAAITAQEIEIYGQTYLPQPGDSPEALAQKKEARSRALRALQAPMRPEATEAVSGAVGGETPAPAPTTLPAAFINNPTVQRLVQENASVGVTAESIWNAMTAEERAAYGG